MLVQGIGTLDKGKYLPHFGGRQTREYSLWCAMLRRCYSKNTHEDYPTYENCKVSDNFASFQYFAYWCNKQIGFNVCAWKLDKDILGDGNLYSEDNCVFIPNILNTAFIKPYGHYFNNSRNVYEVRISRFGKTSFIGSFKDKLLAEDAYSSAKKSYINEILSIYESELDNRVIKKLMS